MGSEFPSTARATGSGPTDRVRAGLVVGLLAAFAFGWLWSLALTPAPWPSLVLIALTLGVVLAPTLAETSSRRQAVAVAALGGALVTVVAALGLALSLPGVEVLTLVAVALAMLLAVGVVGWIHSAPLVAEADTRPAVRASSTGTLIEEERFRPGAHIGRYTLEERIGAGGMGEVWRASHETLLRPAVVKIIKRRPDSDPQRDHELIERFRQEAVITANLSSPHTVHLYDFGAVGSDVDSQDSLSLYIAMELLEAMSIGAIVKHFGPMDEARVAFLLRHACHSLIEAHESGVVHRDIKPDNLLVTRAGGDSDFLKVIDFGLVKDLGGMKRPKTGRQARAQQLTAFGARPGTPGYMAPEQIGGASIDQRTDIYALACVAYFALTGQPVFEGTEEAQLMFAHMQVEPDPPSARVGRALHAGLEAVVMRCLAKDPSERPGSMAELDKALAALTFEPPWTQERAREWWTDERSKHRTRVYGDEPK